MIRYKHGWYLIFFCLYLAADGKAQKEKKYIYVSREFTPQNSFALSVEGPAVDHQGILYAVNFAREHTIGKVTPDGQASLFLTLPNGSNGNGIRFRSDGRMMIADYTNHNILMVDMDTKEISVYAHHDQLYQPNDIAIDSKDRLYASDPNWKGGNGRIWRVDTNGRFVLLDSGGTTNGIEVSPDERRLYVNESVQRKIWVYDLAGDGSISNKRLFMEFPDFGMDGMRCDIQGNLYVTRHGKGVVAKISPDGTLLREIKLSGSKPSNIAFGGKDGRTAYVTLQDKGNIETFEVEDPGREWVMMHAKKNEGVSNKDK